MTARYAIYYAPPADHPLTALASAWLGYDAWTGAAIAQPRIAELALDAAKVAALIADPQHYGFHATLKAPFELADDQSEAALLAAFAAFAAEQPGFAVQLAVQDLGGFVALTLAEPSAAMTALHTACVHGFEPFRAALSAADLARRQRTALTAQQDARLQAFGYPWIFDEFRFHMTLTGRVRSDADRDNVIAALAGYFAPVTGCHAVGNACLFRQDARTDPFKVIASADLQAL